MGLNYEYLIRKFSRQVPAACDNTTPSDVRPILFGYSSVFRGVEEHSQEVEAPPGCDL